MNAVRSVLRRVRYAVAVGVAIAIPAAPPAVAAGEFLYLGGVQFATGHYDFADRTNSVYLFNGVSYSTSRWVLSASIPLIYQNTSLVSSSGPGMLPTGTTMGGGTDHHGGHGGMMGTTTVSAESADEVGIGDPFVRADVTVFGDRSSAASAGVAAVVKAPVAELEFGTGEWDYGAGVTGRYLVGRYMVSSSVIYWEMGEPDGVGFDNPFAYDVSAYRRFGRRLSAGVSLSGYTQIIENVDPFRQLGLSLMYMPAPSRSLSGGIVFGMTESTPDVGVTVGWGLTL